LKKAIVFDSSTIISLALNNLLWILQPLKEQYKGDFWITESVRKEIIDRPFTIKKYKLESIQISNEIQRGVLQVYPQDLSLETKELSNKANKVFFGKKNSLQIIDEGELSVLVLAEKINAEAVAIDERTTRLLLEAPKSLQMIFRERFNEDIKVNTNELKEFQEQVKGIQVIRSIELCIIAFEKGILNTYLQKTDLQSKKDLLDALLWSMRLKGCSISDKEMQEILNEEIKPKFIPSKR